MRSPYVANRGASNQLNGKAREPGEFRVGDVVVYRDPMIHEVETRFRLVEIDGKRNRCYVQAICDMRLRPVMLAPLTYFKLADNSSGKGFERGLFSHLLR